MKRITVLVLACLLLFSGCTRENTVDSGKNDNKNKSCGVWISFSEVNSLLNDKNEFEKEISTLISNCVSIGTENVYIHVRAFCDSLYNSDYFPINEYAKQYDFDVFRYMLDGFHENGIKVHAWVNPYRISTSSSQIESLNTESAAYKWLNDQSGENDKNVCITDSGIYLNPCEAEVRELVINGVREIVLKYDVDGIHFDDYFYPSKDFSFDEKSYNLYKDSQNNPLSLDEWRTTNVNSLISGCYTAIKHINPNVVFSISPAASIEKNKNDLYADVKHWVQNGYVDCIIPQLYFGFSYPDENFCFDKLLTDWEKLMAVNKDVDMYIGLASYKVGTDTPPDCNEWQNDESIISRQVKTCMENDRVKGYVFFSYSSLFSGEELNKKSLEALKITAEGK